MIVSSVHTTASGVMLKKSQGATMSLKDPAFKILLHVNATLQHKKNAMHNLDNKMKCN